MKAHTEIECDPKVWNQVESLIYSKLPPETRDTASAIRTRLRSEQLKNSSPQLPLCEYQLQMELPRNPTGPTMADAVRTTPVTSSAFGRWWGQARTSFFWMVFVAFALRFGWIVVAHTYKFKTLDDNFSFGWEMGRIGRSLAQGKDSAIHLTKRPDRPPGSRRFIHS